MGRERSRRFLLLGFLVLVLLFLLALASMLERLPVGSASDSTGLPGSVTFSVPSGIYDEDIRLRLDPQEPDGQVIFTTDGTTPTLEVGTLYEHPLFLDADYPDLTIVRAVEVRGGQSSPVVNGTYAVGLECALPILSLAVSPEDLWDTEQGIFVNTWERGQAWERPVHVTYLTKDDGIAFDLDGGLRIHGSEPYDAPKQSLRLYFRSEYGTPRLVSSLFPDHPEQSEEEQSYKRLLLQAADRSGRWTLIRDQLMAEVAADLGLRVAQGRFVHLFINGESWGIYHLTERVDRFFLEDNYAIEEADLVQDGRQREGTDEGWDALADWVKDHDLSDPQAFAHFQSQMDLDSFTDFAVLYLYFGFSSEDLYAVRPAGGRWSFIYGGGSAFFAQRPDVSLSDLLEADTDFALFLRKLLNNTAYRYRFGERAAEILNTVLLSSPMQQRVEDLAADLADDIEVEAARWPAPLPWEANVASLVDYVGARPEQMLRQMVEVLGFQELVMVDLGVAPEEGGVLFLDGVSDGERYRSGRYFRGTSLRVVAAPEPGYAFTGWYREDGTEISLSPRLDITVTEALEAVANFAPQSEEGTVRPDLVVINELWINDDGTRYASLGNRALEGDWVELRVQGSGGVDLRGWRLTDNDTKGGTDEGSLIFPEIEALAAVPQDTIILVVATESGVNAAQFPQDDLDARDGRLLFYVGNGNLDVRRDPGFGIGVRDDNLALLAPGPTDSFGDDVGVDFVAEGGAVTPSSFGVLEEGVRFDHPFRRLGGDDGALFTGDGSNDDLSHWVVDPPAHESGDAFRLDSTNRVTPGSLNEGQGDSIPVWFWSLAVLVLGLALVRLLR